MSLAAAGACPTKFCCRPRRVQPSGTWPRWCLQRWVIVKSDWYGRGLLILTLCAVVRSGKILVQNQGCIIWTAHVPDLNLLDAAYVVALFLLFKVEDPVPLPDNLVVGQTSCKSRNKIGKAHFGIFTSKLTSRNVHQAFDESRRHSAPQVHQKVCCHPEMRSVARRKLIFAFYFLISLFWFLKVFRNF